MMCGFRCLTTVMCLVLGLTHDSLTYDAVSSRYTYVWKTDKTWVRLCGELQLKLTDGEVYRARFMFRK